MKIEINFSKNFFEILADFLRVAGLVIFFGTFWLPSGFFLGGDANFFGPRISALEIVFPFCGIGIFLVFFSKIFLKSPRNLCISEIIFLLIFLALQTIFAIFSRDPQISILFLILWATGILAADAGAEFFVAGFFRRTIFFAGIFFGVIFEKFFAHQFLPPLEISKNLLGAAALLGSVFLILENNFFGRQFLLIFYSWIIFQSGNFPLIFAALALFLSVNFWHRTREKKFAQILLPFFLLFSLTIWQFFSDGFFFPKINFALFSEIFFDPQKFFFGVGPGQFLFFAAEISQNFLLPPGIFSTFFETGIFGAAAIFTFFFVPKIFRPQKKIIFSILFFYFWLFLPEFFVLENAIFFTCALIFAEKKINFKNLI